MNVYQLRFPSGEVVHQADTLELAEYAAKNLVEIPEDSRLYVSDPSGVVLSTWFPSNSAAHARKSNTDATAHLLRLDEERDAAEERACAVLDDREGL